MTDHTTVLNEYTAGGWDYPDTVAMAQEIARLRRVLELLREPAIPIVDEAHSIVMADWQDVQAVLRYSVAAAEREAG